MRTVEGMLKRMLVIAAGAAFGLFLASLASHFAPAAWSWWPNRDLDRQAAYFRKVLNLVADNYVDARDAGYDNLTKAALEGMLKSLDPHSEFLQAEENRELQEEMDGRFGGIGIQVEQRDGWVVVIAPIAGTPGDRAGIRRGDRIAKVDGQSLEGESMDKVIRRLRGKPKSRVNVTLYRPSSRQIIDLTLTREIIKIESVRDTAMIEPGIGYIQLTHFSERTGVEFKAALAQLDSQGMEALVLDLRNNPGGLLDTAVEVAEAFFQPGELIVYTQGRAPESRQNLYAGSKAGGRRLPVAALVNAGSASASEVVAGALKDTGRGVVVGETTFGKGSVQTIFRLPNSEAVRLTTARYYTPGGATIHEKGIEPQVAAAVSLDDEAKLHVQRARRDLADPKEFEARFGFEPIADRPLQTAVDALKGVRLFDARNEK